MKIANRKMKESQWTQGNKKTDIFEKFKPSRKNDHKLFELREQVTTDTFWLNYLNLRKVDQKVKFYPLRNLQIYIHFRT